MFANSKANITLTIVLMLSRLQLIHLTKFVADCG